MYLCTVKCLSIFFFFFKQKTAYEIYQCDWSSDVCSSDLVANVSKNEDGLEPRIIRMDTNKDISRSGYEQVTLHDPSTQYLP